MKDKTIIIVAAIVVVIITMISVGWLFSLSPVVQTTEQPTALIIHGPDAIEVGEKVNYALTLDGRVCINNLEDQVVEWSISRNGQLMNVGQTTVTVMSHSAGEFVLRAEFSGMTTQKEIQVHPRASLSFNMDTWIHREWEFTGIVFSGTAEPSLKLYKVLETGRRVDVSSGTWETYGFSELIIREYGNYLLIAESRALSDGRLVSAEKALTVTPYVQRGYHQFDWDREDLVQLTKADKMAVINFLNSKEIETSLLPQGSLRTVNRIDSDYVFYKDSSRGDTILYQTDVMSQGVTNRKVWQSSIKGADSRPWYICWDDFIITANRNDPGLKLSYRDSGSSSSGGSGGGGPMPSPPIGG